MKIFKLLKNLLNSIFYDTFIEEKLIAFICEGEALPTTLSVEEEKILLQKLAENDDSAKSELI